MKPAKPKEKEEIHLMKVCPPYQSECCTEYNMADPVVMAGKSYANAFEVGGSYRVESNFAIYNLNGQYDVIRFEAGHIDGRDMEDTQLSIYLDGELAYVVELDGEMLPTEYSFDLKGALQMKLHTDYKGDNYAIANAVLE